MGGTPERLTYQLDAHASEADAFGWSEQIERAFRRRHTSNSESKRSRFLKAATAEPPARAGRSASAVRGRAAA